MVGENIVIILNNFRIFFWDEWYTKFDPISKDVRVYDFLDNINRFIYILL